MMHSNLNRKEVEQVYFEIDVIDEGIGMKNDPFVDLWFFHLP